MSADYIYEKLAENSGYLKPMYSQMLALYRSGRDKEAFKLPAKIIGTKAAGNFALILSKLDKLNPAELVEQMNIFQSSMIEKASDLCCEENAEKQRHYNCALSLVSICSFNQFCRRSSVYG